LDDVAYTQHWALQVAHITLQSMSVETKEKTPAGKLIAPNRKNNILILCSLSQRNLPSTDANVHQLS